MKSWKTTLSGLIIGIALISGELRDLVDAVPSTVFEWDMFLAGLGSLGLGFSSRDNKVTSEDVGAK